MLGRFLDLCLGRWGGEGGEGVEGASAAFLMFRPHERVSAAGREQER